MKEKPKKNPQTKPPFDGGALQNVVVLYGGRRAVIRGCKKILSYAPDEICLAQSGQTVCLRGRNLVCASFSAGGATIRGDLSAVLLRRPEREVKP